MGQLAGMGHWSWSTSLSTLQGCHHRTLTAEPNMCSSGWAKQMPSSKSHLLRSGMIGKVVRDLKNKSNLGYQAAYPPRAPLTGQPFPKGRNALFRTAAPSLFVHMSPEVTVQSCVSSPNSLGISRGKGKALSKSTATCQSPFLVQAKL